MRFLFFVPFNINTIFIEYSLNNSLLTLMNIYHVLFLPLIMVFFNFIHNFAEIFILFY